MVVTALAMWAAVEMSLGGPIVRLMRERERRQQILAKWNYPRKVTVSFAQMKQKVAQVMCDLRGKVDRKQGDVGMST